MAVLCVHCASPITESDGFWEHAKDRDPGCRDVLGRLCLAAPTRSYLAARAAGFDTVEAWQATWPTWRITRVDGRINLERRAPTPTQALRDALGDSVEAVLDADGLYVLRSRRFRVEVVP